METFLSVGLSNAVAASALALVASVVGRVSRRPAVVHGVWLLVLIKLVTPPLVTVPVPWPSTPEPATPPVVVEEDVTVLTVVLPDTPVTEDHLTSETAAPPPDMTPAPDVWTGTLHQPLLLAVWATGSVGWLVLVAVRSVRFQRLLRFAEPAGAALQDRVHGLASKLGLRAGPAVWLLPGRLSPMLWPAGGSAALFLPAALLSRLTPEQLDALLIHELAHLKRRDHWVRALELLTAVLYWWHPVVWWARRQIREAEEQCCDAWVVWALPGSRRAYALALVETVDFLSDPRTPLPSLASGFGGIHDLKRRVTMIMRGKSSRVLGLGGLAVLLGLGLTILPLLPVWAQPPPPADRKDDRKPVPDRAREEIKELEERLADLRDKLRETEVKLAQARKQLEDAHVTRNEERVILRLQGADGKVQTIELPPGTKLLPGPGGSGQGYGMGGGRGTGFGPGGTGPMGPNQFPLGGGDGGKTPRGADTVPAPAGPTPAPERKELLERKLEELNIQLEELKRELRKQPNRPGAGSPDGDPRPR